MMSKKFFVSALFFGILFIHLSGDVPLPKTMGPEIPGFLQSMNFMSLKLRMFPQPVAGMLPDVFGDMTWNPAYLNDYRKPLIYFDWNAFQKSSATIAVSAEPGQYYEQYDIRIPWWYYRSERASLDASHLYNLALIFPVGSRLTVGFSSRTVFDQDSWFASVVTEDENTDRYRNDGYSSSVSNGNLKTLDIEKNQQSITGTQMELSLGFKISENFLLGLKAGHFTYNQEGSILTDLWEENPRNESDYIKSGSRNNSANHWDVGLGIVFNISERSRLGLSASYIWGDGAQDLDVYCGDDHLYEGWWDPEYKYERQYGNQLRENRSFDGNRTKFAITFEHEFSKKMRMRSFLSFGRSQTDTGAEAKTFYHYLGATDYWRWELNRQFEIDGQLEQPAFQWGWMNSIVYSPSKGSWIFAGIQLKGSKQKKEIKENALEAIYDIDMYASYYYYREYKTESNYKSKYQYEMESNELMISLPLGLSIEVVKNLNVVVGANLSMKLSRSEISGRLSYPEKSYQYWRDNELMIDDDESERLEKYSETPPKKFDREWGHSFGLIYRLSSVFRLYFSSRGDVWDTGNWALGVDVTF